MSGWVAARAGGTMQSVGTSDAQLGYHALRPRFGASPTNRGRLHLEGLAQMSGIETPCVETTWKRDRGGYGRRRVRNRNVRAHRVAWEAANGPIPAGLSVLHRCDNPPCINVQHLFLGTLLDNNRDRWMKQRYAIGTDVKSAKINPEIVRAILAETKAGATRAALARKYGIRAQNVSQIVLGRAWAHVAPIEERA